MRRHTLFTDVYDFNREILEIPWRKDPGVLNVDDRLFAWNSLTEEVNELWDADTYSEQVDALIDVMYFAMGNLYKMGVTEEQAQAFFNNVHEANMKKVKGMTDRGYKDDAIKPEGWEAPHHNID